MTEDDLRRVLREELARALPKPRKRVRPKDSSPAAREFKIATYLDGLPVGAEVTTDDMLRATGIEAGEFTVRLHAEAGRAARGQGWAPARQKGATRRRYYARVPGS